MEGVGRQSLLGWSNSKGLVLCPCQTQCTNSSRRLDRRGNYSIPSIAAPPFQRGVRSAKRLSSPRSASSKPEFSEPVGASDSPGVKFSSTGSRSEENSGVRRGSKGGNAILTNSESDSSSEEQIMFVKKPPPMESISELSRSLIRNSTSRPFAKFSTKPSNASPPTKIVRVPNAASNGAHVRQGTGSSSVLWRNSVESPTISTNRKTLGTLTQTSSHSQPAIKSVPRSSSTYENFALNPSTSSTDSFGQLSNVLNSTEISPERVSSSARSSSSSRRKEQASSSSEVSLDWLHQMLEDRAKDHSSQVILHKPLGPEEAERLRERLAEQKQKSIQEIHRRLRKQRGAQDDGQGGHGFSCAVDPESLILGEYVVHKRVGVGKYIGMKSEIPPGKVNPTMYIYLKYADGIAKLKARSAQRLLYRYHLPGEIGGAPPLSRLKDPTLWDKRKNKGKIAVQKMVVNMMELYIHRLKQSRPPYPKNSAAMARFAAKFPHTPTPDQLQAFADVERDMTDLDLPMDRLVCGDVGFGKTEVALRALFIAVQAGKQVMLLTPSTVLAKQHYETISDRFAGFPGVKVALLCRFQKDSEKKDLIMGIADGSLSIVVGTHSLLGSKIRYNNLGLLVIDEEQRFGVRQKEKITCLKTTVDVLTLSATPIPRTLYLAMSGFRDASLLTVPPPERKPIQTHLMQCNEGQAKKAIQFELDRGGQVFYVVPKVKGIEILQQRLQSQFPQVEVAIAHGKQPSSVLEEAMQRFCEGETRILVCTNIIESGLDIQRVNTIIVEDVHHFGLAQLYQLRGRVGRGQLEAHAYLFHPHKSVLTDEALERLVVLQECCNLGQGFQLAERDMAIRGVGSLFGEQQSGDAAKIGTDLYFEMLLEGLSKVASQRLSPVQYEDVQLELGMDSHVPSDYISSPEEREAAVRAAEQAARESLRTLMLATNRMRDNYGREPAPMEVLLKMMYIRRMAADLGIHRIRMQGTSVLMETKISLGAFEMISSSIPSDSIRSSLHFEDGCIEMQGLIGLPKERQMDRVFCCLSNMFNGLPSFVKYI